MYNLKEIFEETLRLPEYQRKQLALALISSTLNDRSYKDSIELFETIEPNAKIERKIKSKEASVKLYKKIMSKANNQ